MAEACATFHAGLTADDSEEGLEMRKAAFRRLALDGEDEDAILCLRAQGEEAGQIAALAVLVQSELEAFNDLGPWLTGLLSDPSCDHDALQAALCEQIEQLADELGYAQIFVQTLDAATFKARGYAEIEPFEKDGKEHWVLGKALAD